MRFSVNEILALMSKVRKRPADQSVSSLFEDVLPSSSFGAVLPARPVALVHKFYKIKFALADVKTYLEASAVVIAVKCLLSCNLLCTIN